jgi:hypothetical protein
MPQETAVPGLPHALIPPSSLALPPLRSPKLLDQLRERIRPLQYRRRTEEAYVPWCRAFIRFHGMRHPLEMGWPSHHQPTLARGECSTIGCPHFA